MLSRPRRLDNLEGNGVKAQLMVRYAWADFLRGAPREPPPPPIESPVVIEHHFTFQHHAFGSN
ncbi:hypothetical protein Ddye_023206 [Dipteronia dyeriana]|uniref:Uncharacterized protein n=1 Tax=Dipteronia dyeriana TaxID=168575 RepID=A0AAD9TT60_9ROSI|nr:hypothetical protein Ddye_023206 [Dipteronia dyeriana]